MTKNINCSLNFSLFKCVIQELCMGKMIGRAREKDGLYFLEVENDTVGSNLLSYLFSVPHPIKPKFGCFIFILVIHHLHH